MQRNDNFGGNSISVQEPSWCNTFTCTYIIPKNQFFQLTIVEVIGLISVSLRNISSDPNQQTLLRISSQITQSEEED